MNLDNAGKKVEDVIRIDRRGRRKFALGDNPAVELDVAETYQDWCELDASFRGEDGRIPLSDIPKVNGAAWMFAAQKLGVVCTNLDEMRQKISLAEALNFITILKKEYARVVDFFDESSPEEPSSPERTELVFSQE